MRYRNSLRFRIFATFVGTGLLLGPLLALGFITLANELEEFAVQRALATRLYQVMAKDAEPATSAQGTSRWRVFDDIDFADFPQELEGKSGFYTFESGQPPKLEATLPAEEASGNPGATQSLFVAVGEKGGVMYAVASDQTTLELRESLSSWVLAAGTFLSVCASLWFGYHITSRLIRPLQALAASTADSDGAAININPEDYPEDEIGLLAHALKQKHDGMTQSLLREKAFSAEVAHELRNPLAVIQSSMEIMARDIRIATPSARALDRALDASREMNGTLSALLLLGRQQSAPALYPPTDVASVVSSVIERSAADGAQQLHWQQNNTPTLTAPPEAIRMIADNLIRNALQNTPRGRVDVALLEDRLLVQDTGIGIPPAELSAVRNHGIRGSNTPGSGSGLGLALVDRLCAAFDWQLEIHSTLNEGTSISWIFAPNEIL